VGATCRAFRGVHILWPFVFVVHPNARNDQHVRLVTLPSSLSTMSQTKCSQKPHQGRIDPCTKSLETSGERLVN
jgi:hypothetical protein